MRRRVAADAGHIVDADDAGESDDDGDGGGDEDEAVLGDDEEEWDRHIALNPQDAVDQERGKERLFEKVRVCVCVCVCLSLRLCLHFPYQPAPPHPTTGLRASLVALWSRMCPIRGTKAMRVRWCGTRTRSTGMSGVATLTSSWRTSLM